MSKYLWQYTLVKLMWHWYISNTQDVFLQLNASSSSRLLAESFLNLSPFPYNICKESYLISKYLWLGLKFKLEPLSTASTDNNC